MKFPDPSRVTCAAVTRVSTEPDAAADAGRRNDLESEQLDVVAAVVLLASPRRCTGPSTGTSCCRRRTRCDASAVALPCAISSAPSRFAPELMPTAMPSSFARRCDITIASPSQTSRIRRAPASFTIDGTNSSLMPWMRCRPTLWPVRSVGEFAGSSGCAATPLPKRSRRWLRHAHDGAARAHAGDERRRQLADRRELRGDLGTRGFVVRLHVGGVVELLRAEYVAGFAREFVRHANRPQEPAELRRHRDHRGAEALDHQHAFARHPVRHVDAHGVAERAADGGEGNAGVAAGRLGDHVAGGDLTARVGALQDVQRHAVLDAAGEVVRLVFGVDAVLVPAIAAVDLEQRRAADQPCQRDQLLASGTTAVMRHEYYLTRRVRLRMHAEKINPRNAKSLHPARWPGRIPRRYPFLTQRSNEPGDKPCSSAIPAWWRPPSRACCHSQPSIEPSRSAEHHAPPDRGLDRLLSLQQLRDGTATAT